MNTYLAIDYGQAHIGLALADHMLATPLPSLSNTPKLFSQLSTLVVQHGITHIILGLPTGPLVSEIRSFATKLKSALSLPVIFHDETLSSQDATRLLIAGGASRRKRQNEHSYAAALILEDYLENVKLNH